ncbi:hypothetical protein D3C74_194170 [compost metagenome]
MQLDSSINDSFGALSVLIVFSTLLFSMRYPEIIKDLEIKFSVDKAIALANQKRELVRNLVFKWGPVVLITFICAYVMMPLGIEVLVESKFHLYKFDIMRTTYVLVWYFSILLFVSTLYLGIRLICKIINAK